LRNTFTPGTKGINGFYFPSNEDWAMVVEVTAFNSETRQVFGRKIFDIGTTQYRATVISSNPNFSVGSHVVFYRVGKEMEDFICFSSRFHTLVIEDESEGFGHEVRIDDQGSYYRPPESETLPLIPQDALTSYHNSKPPFAAGRRYFGQKIGGVYLVDLPGLGLYRKTLSTVFDAKILDMDIDGQGNLLDLRVASTPVIAAAYNKKCYVYDYETATWHISHGIFITTTGVAGASASALYAGISTLGTTAYWNSALPWGTLGLYGVTKWVAAGIPLYTLSAYFGGTIPMTCYSKTGRIFALKDTQTIVEYDVATSSEIVLHTHATGSYNRLAVSDDGNSVCAVGTSFHSPSDPTYPDYSCGLVSISNGDTWADYEVPSELNTIQHESIQYWNHQPNEGVQFTDVKWYGGKFWMCGEDKTTYSDYYRFYDSLLNQGWDQYVSYPDGCALVYTATPYGVSKEFRDRKDNQPDGNLPVYISVIPPGPPLPIQNHEFTQLRVNCITVGAGGWCIYGDANYGNHWQTVPVHGGGTQNLSYYKPFSLTSAGSWKYYGDRVAAISGTYPYPSYITGGTFRFAWRSEKLGKDFALMEDWGVSGETIWLHGIWGGTPGNLELEYGTNGVLSVTNQQLRGVWGLDPA